MKSSYGLNELLRLWSFFKIWVLVFFFFFFFLFLFSFLVKTCSVVNLPHKIHRNNFFLFLKKKKLSLYTISSGTFSWQCYAPLKLPHRGPYHFICYPFLTHPSPSYMGMSIDWQRKFTFFLIKMQSMQKTLILMQKKIKLKKYEKQGGGRCFKRSSTCWNGGWLTEWSEMGNLWG